MRPSKQLRKPGSLLRWRSDEDETLTDLAGSKTVREIAIIMKRTERSVRIRLSRRNLSGRLREGHTQRFVAEDLHVARARIRQWILDGKLPGHSPQVTRGSIKKLCQREGPEIVRNGEVIAVLGRPPWRVLRGLQRSENTRQQGQNRSDSPRNISQSYTFARAGRLLQVGEEVVNRLVNRGLLKLTRMRIDEDILDDFVREHPEEINWHLLDDTVLKWFGINRDDARKAAAKRSGFLKHVFQERICPGCHRRCRGNAYWSHVKVCRDARKLAQEELDWAADHPRSVSGGKSH